MNINADDHEIVESTINELNIMNIYNDLNTFELYRELHFIII